MSAPLKNKSFNDQLGTWLSSTKNKYRPVNDCWPSLKCMRWQIASTLIFTNACTIECWWTLLNVDQSKTYFTEFTINISQLVAELWYWETLFSHWLIATFINNSILNCSLFLKTTQRESHKCSVHIHQNVYLGFYDSSNQTFEIICSLFVRNVYE